MDNDENFTIKNSLEGGYRVCRIIGTNIEMDQLMLNYEEMQNDVNQKAKCLPDDTFIVSVSWEWQNKDNNKLKVYYCLDNEFKKFETDFEEICSLDEAEDLMMDEIIPIESISLLFKNEDLTKEERNNLEHFVFHR